MAIPVIQGRGSANSAFDGFDPQFDVTIILPRPEELTSTQLRPSSKRSELGLQIRKRLADDGSRSSQPASATEKLP